jgi:hypothetical protein
MPRGRYEGRDRTVHADRVFGPSDHVRLREGGYRDVHRASDILVLLGGRDRDGDRYGDENWLGPGVQGHFVRDLLHRYPHAYPNGHADRVPDADADGHADWRSYADAYQYADGNARGSDAHADQYADGDARASDAHADQYADGDATASHRYADEHADARANTHADEYSDAGALSSRRAP